MKYFYLPDEKLVVRENDEGTDGFIVSTSSEDLFAYTTKIQKPIEGAEHITVEEYVAILEVAVIGIQWDRNVYRDIFEQNNETIQ
jgi:hypothetical protein